MYRAISPKKIIALRGTRSREAIAASVNHQISGQEIYCYEKGIYRPSEKKLAWLIKALDCSFEDISEPVELIAA